MRLSQISQILSLHVIYIKRDHRKYGISSREFRRLKNLIRSNYNIRDFYISIRATSIKKNNFIQGKEGIS